MSTQKVKHQTAQQRRAAITNSLKLFGLSITFMILGCVVNPNVTEGNRLGAENLKFSHQYHSASSEFSKLQTEAEFRKTPQGAEVTLREAGWLGKDEVAINVRR